MHSMVLESVSVQRLDGSRNSYDIMYLKNVQREPCGVPTTTSLLNFTSSHDNCVQQGRHIRYIHLPKSLDPARAILQQAFVYARTRPEPKLCFTHALKSCVLEPLCYLPGAGYGLV
eukprot:356348-Chlamydomonas_euryale.AAC.16